MVIRRILMNLPESKCIPSAPNVRQHSVRFKNNSITFAQAQGEARSPWLTSR